MAHVIAYYCFLFCNQDHTYCFNMESAKDTVLLLQKRVANIEREKCNAIRRDKRSKTKCADILKELNEKNLLTAELEDKLSTYKGTYMYMYFEVLNSLMVANVLLLVSALSAVSALAGRFLAKGTSDLSQHRV